MRGRHLSGIAILVLTTALFSESRADEKQPPPAKAVNAAAAKLIDKLTEVAHAETSQSPFYPAGNFAPLQERTYWGNSLLDDKPSVRSDVFRELSRLRDGHALNSDQRSDVFSELVKLGAAAVPDLVAHLGDHRPTHVTIWGELSKKEDKDDSNSYTAKVGDLCCLALGQIVNRDYTFVMFYDNEYPGLSAIISPPTRDAKLRDKLKKQWGELTPEQHRKSLLKDCAGDISPQAGAFLRLAWYFPDALEAPALQFLARPSYSLFDAREFVHTKLYTETDGRKRRALFDAYLKQYGEAAHEGLREILYYDLWEVELVEKAINRAQPNSARSRGNCSLNWTGRPRR